MSGCTAKSMEVQPNPCAKVVYTAHPTAESGRVQRKPAGAVHHAQSAEVGFVGSQRKDHLAVGRGPELGVDERGDRRFRKLPAGKGLHEIQARHPMSGRGRSQRIAPPRRPQTSSDAPGPRPGDAS